MRLVTLLIIIVGLIGCSYIAVHLKRVPFIKYFEKKAKWLPLALSIFLAFLLWYFSFIKYTILMAFSIYLVGFFVLTDIIWFIFSRVKKIKESKFLKGYKKLIYNGLLILILATSLTIIAGINGEEISVTPYDITIKKEVKDEPIKIAMVTDMHIGTGINEKDLKEFDENINKLNPDIVCLVGDIFDERTTLKQMEILEESLKNIKTKYGIYYVYGNHDLGKYRNKKQWGQREVINTLKDGGVNILEDESVLIDKRFYLVGRKEMSMNTVPEKPEPRKNTMELTKNLNKKYPIILMDHRPLELEDSKKAGVDLQLSGHTHAGQLTPLGTFLKFMPQFSEVIYGHEQHGNFNIVVSSGYGTWGMPARLGSPSEIASINLFGQK